MSPLSRHDRLRWQHSNSSESVKISHECRLIDVFISKSSQNLGIFCFFICNWPLDMHANIKQTQLHALLVLYQLCMNLPRDPLMPLDWHEGFPRWSSDIHITRGNRDRRENLMTVWWSQTGTMHFSYMWLKQNYMVSHIVEMKPCDDVKSTYNNRAITT